MNRDDVRNDISAFLTQQRAVAISHLRSPRSWLFSGAVLAGVATLWPAVDMTVRPIYCMTPDGPLKAAWKRATIMDNYYEIRGIEYCPPVGTSILDELPEQNVPEAVK